MIGGVKDHTTEDYDKPIIHTEVEKGKGNHKQTRKKISKTIKIKYNWKCKKPFLSFKRKQSN